MKFHICFAALVLFFAIDMKTTVYGFDQEDVMLHGFASQGYLKSSHNNYLGNSSDGSFEFNEIGVNFLVPVTDSLRFGIQFFSMDLGNYGNNELIVDWALLDYNINQYIGVRAGKVKGPVGLRNRSRDVDNLRTPIILNQAVYPEGFREMIVAIYGFNPYGSASLGAFGEIDYDIFSGVAELTEGNPFVNDIFNRFTYTDPIFGPILGALDISDIKIDVKHAEGFLLVWNTPLSGMALGFTGISARFDAPLIDDIIIKSKLKEYTVLSFKYDIRNVSIISEWMNFNMDFDLQGIGTPVSFVNSLEGWYAEISWKAIHRLYFAASYGEYYPDADDKKGDKYKNSKEDQPPSYYAWQKDTTLSTRYDLNEYLCVKFEVHFIDGLGLTEINDFEPGNMKRHWNLYACKVSLNF